MKRSFVVKTTTFLVAAFLLVEAVLRWGVGMGHPPLVRLNPTTEYELIGPAAYHRWGNEISVNAQGMRAPAFEPDPGPNARRILLIGDSVVYGGHFLDQSETIASQVAAQLSELDQFDECEILVLPVAASSWGPVNQAGFLERDGTFGAQSAGIVVSGHDLYDTPEGGATILPYRTKAPFGATHDAFVAVLERVFPKQPHEPEMSLKTSAVESLAALSRIVQQLKIAGIAPTLYYHPTITERTGTLRDEARRFKEWAALNGVRVVDLSVLPITPDAYQDDIHPNVRGAEKLARFFVDDLSNSIEPCSL
jgi:hypothetical protein